jgi:hypothetical protein
MSRNGAPHDQDVRRYTVAALIRDNEGHHTIVVGAEREIVTRTIRFLFLVSGKAASLSRHEISMATQAVYAHYGERACGVWVEEDKEYAATPAPRDSASLAEAISRLRGELAAFSETPARHDRTGPMGRPRKTTFSGSSRGPCNRNREDNS